MSHYELDDLDVSELMGETDCASCKKITRCPTFRITGDFVACEHCGKDVHLGTTFDSWAAKDSLPCPREHLHHLDDHNTECEICGACVEPEKAGKKFDIDKTQYHYMPLHALEQTNRVLTYGAIKYGPGNWRHVPEWQTRYYNAALRHIFQWQSGEKLDSETGVSHLAHAICSLMFLIEKENKTVNHEIRI